MKIAGIIAEYNPFHNGHVEHIMQTREQTEATHVVAVMSGNFTQRGDLAIVDKHLRAKAALENGVDLVVELPVAFSLSSAEQFAVGGVALLNALGCVDVLSFGSECGDIEKLKEAAGAVHYAQTTYEFFGAMKRGKSYPAALQAAVEKYYTEDVADILASPNNTLAVEYIKALNESGSDIQPFTIERVGAAHDAENYQENSVEGITSASQLRKVILNSKVNVVDVVVNGIDVMVNGIDITANGEVNSVNDVDIANNIANQIANSVDVANGVDISEFSPMPESDFADFADIMRLETAILAKLRNMSIKEIHRAPNVQGGIENRIFRAARAARTLSELYFLSKTKRYTLARIRRAVLCCFLGITKGDVKLKPQYVRIIGMNDKGKEILSAASECGLPIDSSLAALMKKNDKAKRQAILEERCGNIYALAFEKRRACGGEFVEKLVKL